MKNCLTCKHYVEYLFPVNFDYSNMEERCGCTYEELSTTKKDFKPYCCEAYSPKERGNRYTEGDMEVVEN